MRCCDQHNYRIKSGEWKVKIFIIFFFFLLLFYPLKWKAKRNTEDNDLNLLTIWTSYFHHNQANYFSVKLVKKGVESAITRKMAKYAQRRTLMSFTNYFSKVVIALVLVVSNFHIQCGPSAQQEQELLLLDALSRKQPFSSNLNSISSVNSNYETNTLMDMLGRSMLYLKEKIPNY